MPKTQTVTMLELRKSAEAIVDRVRRGQRLVLTYRGRPVVRLEPIRPQAAAADDPFYRLAELADKRGGSLTNSQIDAIIYGT